MSITDQPQPNQSQCERPIPRSVLKDRPEMGGHAGALSGAVNELTQLDQINENLGADLNMLFSLNARLNNLIEKLKGQPDEKKTLQCDPAPAPCDGLIHIMRDKQQAIDVQLYRMEERIDILQKLL